MCVGTLGRLPVVDTQVVVYVLTPEFIFTSGCSAT